MPGGQRQPSEAVNMRLGTPESYGNAAAVETVEIQQQDFHRSQSVLGISRKQRDSHIPTAPTVCYSVSTKQPRRKNWVRWKSGNPKAGFPLSHRTDSLRRKEENPKSVYNAPGTMCIPCAGLDTHSCRCPPSAETSLGAARKGVFITFGGPQAHGNSLTVAVRKPMALANRDRKGAVAC